MKENANRTVDLSNQMKHPVPTCSMCGNAFNFWDQNQDFRVDRCIGFGSRYDLCRLQLNLCIECFDKVLDWLLPQCKLNPLTDCSKEFLGSADLKEELEGYGETNS